MDISVYICIYIWSYACSYILHKKREQNEYISKQIYTYIYIHIVTYYIHVHTQYIHIPAKLTQHIFETADQPADLTDNDGGILDFFARKNPPKI